jgi:hypothetical protein
MRHPGGSSELPDQRDALLVINRMRYQEKWPRGIPALALRDAVVLGSTLRVWKPRHHAARLLPLRRDKRSELLATATASYLEYL